MFPVEQGLSADELIAEIYRQKRLLDDQGIPPQGVRLAREYIRRLRVQGFLMGQPGDPSLEYLGWNSIFGLDFYVHESKDVQVF